jgi:hypothetical protein
LKQLDGPKKGTFSPINLPLTISNFQRQYKKHVIIQEPTNFPKIYMPPHNSRRHNGDMIQVPYDMIYEGRSEINASYFNMLAHDVRVECC